MPFQGKRNSRDDKSTKSNKPYSARAQESDQRSFDKPARRVSDKKEFTGSKPATSNYAAKRGRKSSDDQSFEGKRFSKGEKTFERNKSNSDRPFKSNSFSKGDKPYGRKSNEDRPFEGKRFSGGDRPAGRSSNGDRPFAGKRFSGGEKSAGRNSNNDRPFDNKRFAKSDRSGDRSELNEKRGDRFSKESGSARGRNTGINFPSSEKRTYGNRPFRKSDDKSSFRPARTNDDFAESNFDRSDRAPKRVRANKPAKSEDFGLIRLNRYIANAGICSRRKADDLIAAGVVSVNGEAVTELGLKIDPRKDEIRYNGRVLKREKMTYVLLNKPKDYITTTDDPKERKTVMSLIEKASSERVYPVGRLDRNTTGLLLLTNDGDLAEKLSHPRNQITKIYQVELDKNLTQGDFNKITYGIELEDGFIKPDAVSYVTGGAKNEIGIQIHSGKNRIVRRIFETLGYEVIKLDRVIYANLTKKDLPRGRWRYLDEKEIIQLKHLMQVNPR